MKPPIIINEAIIAQLQALETQMILASEFADYSDLQADSSLSREERSARRASLRSHLNEIADRLPSAESNRAHRRIARARAEEQCWRNWAAKGGPHRSDAWAAASEEKVTP